MIWNRSYGIGLVLTTIPYIRKNGKPYLMKMDRQLCVLNQIVL